MKMIKIATLLAAGVAAAFLLSTKANAADVSFDTIGVHVGSKHSNNNSNWNNDNHGLYGVWKADGISPWVDGRYVLGTYYNSIRKQSYYAGRVLEYQINNTVSAGVIVGVITGYERSPLPMVVPSVAVGVTDNVKARLSVVPKTAKDGAAAIHLSVEWKF